MNNDNTSISIYKCPVCGMKMDIKINKISTYTGYQITEPVSAVCPNCGYKETYRD